jgi:hypothetical protein
LDVARQTALVTAKTFAERYGSYSTDGRYQNLETVLEMATASYRNALQNTIVAGRTKPSSGFVGVTTAAMSARTIGAFAVGSPATVEVLTQRTTMVTSTVVTYETLTVSLSPSDASWLVSSAQWKKIVAP